MATGAARPSSRKPSVTTSLPIELTSFIGRQVELAAVAAELERRRLVTLTGPGGAGKTRLAAQAAAGQADRFADGVWWVGLAGLTDGGDIAEATATALGAQVERSRGALRSLTIHLRDRHALVSLDNAEHLLDDVARLVGDILRSCPAVTVLATSREPLGLAGEAVWPVPPMGEHDALALFLDRARLARPTFELDHSNELAVRRIIERLDRIPLAIELAAAWLRTLTPQQIEAALDDRFALLVRGARGAEDRQQTLAASIDWSYSLLDEQDRVVFRRLAGFAGSFGLAAAQVIAAADPVERGEILAVIGRLVDKSLLIADEQAGETRYRMLETIHAYAWERLVDAHGEASVRNRHLAWYRDFGEQIEPLIERDLDAWRRALEPERDNLRAALDWGLAAADPDAGRRLAASLAWHWHLDPRGRDGIRYLRRAIERAPDQRSRLQARLLTGVALVADTASPLDLEFDAATRALELATEVGDESLLSLGLILAAVGQFYTDFDAAWELCERAYRAAEAGGNGFVLASSRALQAIILHLRDRHPEAEAIDDQVFPELLTRHRGVASTVLANRAGGALATGDQTRALDLAQEAVRLAEPLGDYVRLGGGRSTLAQVRASRGDIAGAMTAVEPDLRLLEDAGDDAWVPGLPRTLGMIELRRGNAQAAVDWFKREAHATDRGMETWLSTQAMAGLGAALVAIGHVEEAAIVLDRALTAARRLDLPATVADALVAQADLAAIDHDRLAEATDLHHAALTIRVEHGLRGSLPDSLEALARLGSQAKPTVDDARMLGASQAARDSMFIGRGAEAQASFGQTLSRLREALGHRVFDEAWAGGTRMMLDDAVAYARRARGVRGRPLAGWASLTPTELDVVRLVADGLTNPQIASRLFMSRGTVKTHLSHVFTKLDVSNRTELATIASSRRSG